MVTQTINLRFDLLYKTIDFILKMVLYQIPSGGVHHGRGPSSSSLCWWYVGRFDKHSWKNRSNWIYKWIFIKFLSQTKANKKNQKFEIGRFTIWISTKVREHAIKFKHKNVCNWCIFDVKSTIAHLDGPIRKVCVPTRHNAWKKIEEKGDFCVARSKSVNLPLPPTEYPYFECTTQKTNFMSAQMDPRIPYRAGFPWE